ncbi:DinB family protein [Nubsella zeaxanthinifaciens]|uniref:DinB family protein n=1 Tax=Nubsella zeaxanthinifaciens TaxID=392412 RepID=UPI003D043E0E
MKAVDKNNFITNLYQRTEVLLDEAVRCYQNLGEEVLYFSANQQSWNIAECLSHLNSYGNYYLPKLEDILSKPNHFSNKAFTAGWLGSYFVKMMQSRGKQFKAAKIHLPNVRDAYFEVAEFISQQERMLKCLKSFEKVAIDDVRIATSINRLIRLKVGDVLEFIVAHHERHAEQIKQIIVKRENMLGQGTAFTAFTL